MTVHMKNICLSELKWSFGYIYIFSGAVTGDNLLAFIRLSQPSTVSECCVV